MDESVTELVGNALRFGNIVNYDAAIPGAMIQRGVSALNDILTMWATDGTYIPYQSELIVPLVVGQQTYTFGNSASYDVNTDPIESVITMVINLTDTPGVDYRCTELVESYYANIPYKLSQGIPSTYLMRNQIDYTEIRFQPIPYSSSMNAKIICKQRLQTVSIGDTLTAIPASARLILKMQLVALAGGIWGKSPTEAQAKIAQDAVKRYLASNVKSLDTTVRRDEMLNLKNSVLFNFWITS